MPFASHFRSQRNRTSWGLEKSWVFYNFGPEAQTFFSHQASKILRGLGFLLV